MCGRLQVRKRNLGKEEGLLNFLLISPKSTKTKHLAQYSLKIKGIELVDKASCGNLFYQQVPGQGTVESGFPSWRCMTANGGQGLVRLPSVGIILTDKYMPLLLTRALSPYNASFLETHSSSLVGSSLLSHIYPKAVAVEVEPMISLACFSLTLTQESRETNPYWPDYFSF